MSNERIEETQKECRKTNLIFFKLRVNLSYSNVFEETNNDWEQF